jgi:hypothetical protein
MDKDYADNVPTILRIVWSAPEENGDSFTVEASTLNANCELNKVRRDTCPHCGKLFHSRHIVKTDYDDTHEDIYGWHFAHDCGAKLLVIND